MLPKNLSAHGKIKLNALNTNFKEYITSNESDVIEEIGEPINIGFDDDKEELDPYDTGKNVVEHSFNLFMEKFYA